MTVNVVIESSGYMDYLDPASAMVAAPIAVTGVTRLECKLGAWTC